MLISRTYDAQDSSLTYRHIRIIQAIAAHGSISQSAEALNMSQPAVTRALQQAEDLLGVKLFDRTPSGVMPTIYAEPVLKRAEAIHATMRETENELRNLKSPELKQLRIGSGIHSTEIWANRAVAELALTYTDLNIRIDRYDWNDLLHHLHEGTVDYGLGEIGDLDADSEWQVEPLAELELYFVCSANHVLAKKSEITVADIAQFPMVGNKLARKITDHFNGQIGRLGHIDPMSGGMFSSIRMTSLNAIKLVLAESDGLALMPLDSVQDEMRRGQLIALSRANMPWLVGRIGFISSKLRSTTPLMKAFRKAVLNVEADRRVRQSQ